MDLIRFIMIISFAYKRNYDNNMKDDSNAVILMIYPMIKSENNNREQANITRMKSNP